MSEQRVRQDIAATIQKLCRTVEVHAGDRSWRYANDAAAVIWQLSRALKELRAAQPEGAPDDR